MSILPFADERYSVVHRPTAALPPPDERRQVFIKKRNSLSLGMIMTKFRAQQSAISLIHSQESILSLRTGEHLSQYQERRVLAAS